MEFSDKGREAFARVTKRIAERGFNASTLQAGGDKDQFNQRFAITLDNQIVSLATIDFTEHPEGIDGRDGAQIENVGSFQDAKDLAESLRIGALPIELKLISKTQVSATLGKQALDQGLLAGAVGLALTILFLLFFYRVLGLVAAAALLIYALLLFALVKLIPITLTLPGIAGLILTSGGGGRRQHRHVRANKGGGARGQVDPGRDLGRLRQGAADDHRRQRGDDRRGVHPVHARHGRRQGLRFHARYRHARLAVHGGAGHLGDPRLDGALAPAAPPECAGRGQGSQVLVASTSWATRSWFFSISGVILLAGAIAIATLGINFGIDFESGTRITTPLERQASVDEVRSTLEPLGYADAKIQQVDDPELGENVFQISDAAARSRTRSTRSRRALTRTSAWRGATSRRNSIGPTFGAADRAHGAASRSSRRCS